MFRQSCCAKLTPLRAYSIARANASSRDAGAGGQQNSNWWSVFSEWKTAGTLGIGILSWYISAREDRVQQPQCAKLNLVSKQIREFYGPLYGNRIVAETSYRAVMKQCGGLKNYLEQAKEKKDIEMIKTWRSYVSNVLYPLDIEARELICSCAHLIADREFPEEFENFLSHSAQMQFVMEQWKNEEGQLRAMDEITEHDFLESTNSTGKGGSKSMIAHLRDQCCRLRKRQQQCITTSDTSEFMILFHQIFK